MKKCLQVNYVFICLGKKILITHVHPSTTDAHIHLTEVLTACQQFNKLSSHLRVNTLLLHYIDDSVKTSYAEIAVIARIIQNT